MLDGHTSLQPDEAAAARIAALTPQQFRMLTMIASQLAVDQNAVPPLPADEE